MIEQKHTTQAQSKPDNDEIDLIALAKTLWNGRKTIIRYTVIGVLIGLFVALFSPKEYTAKTTMIPQSKEGGAKIGGNLGGLAAMAGINIGSMGSGSTIPPNLYPKIVNSIPFQKQLMQTPLNIDGENNEITFAKYYLEVHSPGLLGYIKKYTIGLPGTTIKIIKGNSKDALYAFQPNLVEQQLQSISNEEKTLIGILKNQLSIEVNDKDGDVTLTAKMPQAKAAAQLVKEAQILLQNSITQFKIQKAQEQLVFVEKQYKEKQKEFEKAQQELALFRDRNRNVSTALAQTDLERLQADFNLAFGVYSELAKQLENQKMQVKEDTPVFTIIEPVNIPFERSAPNRPLILIIWTFLGAIIGVALVFAKEFFSAIKEKWDEMGN